MLSGFACGRVEDVRERRGRVEAVQGSCVFAAELVAYYSGLSGIGHRAVQRAAMAIGRDLRLFTSYRCYL